MPRYSTPRHASPRKYYLSNEAIDLLQAEAARTTWSMSVVLDHLIKTHLTPKTVAATPAETALMDEFVSDLLHGRLPQTDQEAKEKAEEKLMVLGPAPATGKDFDLDI